MSDNQFKELCEEYKGGKINVPIEELKPFVEFCVAQIDEQRYERFSDDIQH